MGNDLIIHRSSTPLRHHLTWILSLLIFTLGTGLQAQNLTQTIKGRVIDQQSKTPIIGATVRVKNSEPALGGVTDLQGYFKVDQVPIGRQTLQISSVGYENSVIPDILVKSGKELIINIELKESIVKIDEVVITASSQNKGKVLNEMATVSALSFSVEETSRYPATLEDPARAVTSFAGVTGAGDDLLNEIVIRGNSPKGLLWRLEGVEIPNPNHYGENGSSAGGISMLSSNMLANSDFYTGAFPAQFGNASSGVFDLKMRNGNYDERETTLQAGLLGLAVAAEGPINKETRSSYLVNYRYSTLAVFSALGIQILDPTEEIAFQDLAFKLHFPSKKLGSISLWALGGTNFSIDHSDPQNQWFFDERGDQSVGVIGLTNINYLSKNTFLETILSATGSKYLYTSDSINGQEFFREKINDYTYRVSSLINHKFNAMHTIRVGGIYSYLGYNMREREWDSQSEFYDIPLDSKGNGSIVQAFVQWQFRPNNNLTINPGFHFTYFDINEDIYPEPRLGIEYRLSSKDKITAGFGVHSRRETISLYRSQQLQPDGSYVQQNRNLGFTKANHYVLGFERMLKSNLRFKTELYYQKLYDVPIFHSDTVSDLGFIVSSALNTHDGYSNDKLANNGSGENYGIEMGIEKFFSNNFYYMTNLSLYESNYKAVDGKRRNTKFNGNYVFNFVGGREVHVGPGGNNLININAKVIIAGGQRYIPFDLDASRQNGFGVQDFSRTYDPQLNTYKRVDIGINYRINKAKSSSIFDVSIQNVFNLRNEASRFYSPRREMVLADLQLGILPNINYKLEF